MPTYTYEGIVAVKMERKGATTGAVIESVLKVTIIMESDDEPPPEEVALEAFCEAGEQADLQLDEMYPDRHDDEDDDGEAEDEDDDDGEA
jgi:hypothetical protein